ncbi:MAG: TolC family protein [candidate division WOR-3 bacterium]
MDKEKKRFFLLKKALFLFTTFSFISLGAETLTLDECIAWAKANNLQLLVSRMAVERARKDLTLARADYYPTLGLSSSYRYSSSSAPEERDWLSSGRGSFATGLSLQYPLYKGGAIRTGEKIAEIKLKIAEENYRQTENEVIYSLKQVFFKILQMAEQISLMEEVLKRRQENLILIRLNYNVGRENEPDVKQAAANLEETEYEYLKAQKNLSLAKKELAQILNRPGEEIEIFYEDREKSFPSLDSLLKEAEARRPEMIVAQKNREIAQNQVKLAKSAYFPTLSFSSSYGWQGSKITDQKDNWGLGVNLSLPLFNGFATKAKVAEAKISLKQEDWQMSNLRLKIRQEVEEAYTNWQLSEKNVAVRKKMLAVVRSAYQLTKLQYEQGRTTYFFLQQKEGELTQAENNYLNALYNFRLAIATLEKVLGRSD